MLGCEFRLGKIVADAHRSGNSFLSQAQLSAVRNSNCNAIVPSMLVSRRLKSLLIYLLLIVLAISAPSALARRSTRLLPQRSRRQRDILSPSAISLCCCMPFCSRCPKAAIFIIIFPARFTQRALSSSPCRMAYVSIAPLLRLHSLRAIPPQASLPRAWPAGQHFIRPSAGRILHAPVCPRR